MMVVDDRLTRTGRELLRRLTADDEESARMVLALRPQPGIAPFDAALTPRVRTLVRLAALVADDASTTSLRWAVELAWHAGVVDDEIVAVLLAVGAEIGAPRVIDTAPRLAAAIGYDVDVDDL
jgi:alkylhydroperoxidase/carboxymuconolactone decarboxylase family protein YurZ